MIENRYRIEKEILLGRQSARKSQQAHPRVETPGVEGLPPLTTDIRTPPIFTASPAPTDAENPLAIDTDAEAAYANDLKVLPKRERTRPLPDILRRDTNRQDPLRSPVTRRRWASEMLDAEDADSSEHSSQRINARRTPPSTSPRNVSPRSSGFFSRFRTQSFPAVRSPFSGNSNKSKSHLGEGSVAADETWSTDSSSDEEFSLQDSLHMHHSSVLNMDPMDEGKSSEEGQVGTQSDVEGL